MIARGFVNAGATVYVSSRKAEVGDALAKELSKIGSCTSLPADLSSEAECRRLANEVGARESRLDVLVNNAGATWGAPMETYDDVAFERVLALNVKGVFHLTKFLRPLLEVGATNDNPSRVINIGSIDGLHVPSMETYAYSASKAAVHQLTRHLANGGSTGGVAGGAPGRVQPVSPTARCGRATGRARRPRRGSAGRARRTTGGSAHARQPAPGPRSRRRVPGRPLPGRR